MANTCFSEYIFAGEPRKIATLHNDIKRVLDTPREDKGSDTYVSEPNWLGWLVTDLLHKKWREVYCRGSIHVANIEYDPEHLPAELRFTTDSAWSPCRELFLLLSEKYEVDMYYMSEDPGCELYETNDSIGIYFKARYVINHDDTTEYTNSEEDAVSLINQWQGTAYTTIDEIQRDPCIRDEYDINVIAIV